MKTNKIFAAVALVASLTISLQTNTQSVDQRADKVEDSRDRREDKRDRKEDVLSFYFYGCMGLQAPITGWGLFNLRQP